MRGWRLGVVLAVALAVLFNETPLDARGAPPPYDFSTTQTLRAWDGRGLAIPIPMSSRSDIDATFRRIGGARIIFDANTEYFTRKFLFGVQEDVRRIFREARIGYKALAVRDGAVEVTVRELSDLSRIRIEMSGKESSIGKALGRVVDVHDNGDGSFRFTPQANELDDLRKAAVAQSAYELALQFQSYMLGDFGVKQTGPDRVEILLPGVSSRLNWPQYLRSRTQLSLHLAENTFAGERPRQTRLSDIEVLPYSSKKTSVVMQRRSLLPSEGFRTVAAQWDVRSQKAIVTFRLSPRASVHLAQVTREYAGRAIAVVLNGEVMAMPVVRGVVPNGLAKIDGNFSVEDALRLVKALRVGSFPAPLTLVTEEFVPPASALR